MSDDLQVKGGVVGACPASPVTACSSLRDGARKGGLHQRLRPTGAALAAYAEENCPGHVASDGDPKVCGRCGIHIDSLRPEPEEGP